MFLHIYRLKKLNRYSRLASFPGRVKYKTGKRAISYFCLYLNKNKQISVHCILLYQSSFTYHIPKSMGSKIQESPYNYIGPSATQQALKG